MIYCDQCGAANDILERNCHRCGTPLPTEAELQHAVIGGSAVGAQPPADWHRPDGLSAELELPEWLRTAAEETPHDPALAGAAPAGAPPAGFVVEPPSRPIPAWMTAAAAAAPSDDAVEALTPTPQRPAAPAPDVADTSSFITENDLPDWIRQIAAADEAKRIEERRRAAEAERAAAAVDRANRPPLPGDTTSAPLVTNPWLTRRETVAATRAWDGAPQPTAPVEVAAQPETAPTVEQPMSEAAPLADAIAGTNRDAVPKKGRFGKPKLPQPMDEAAGQSPLRLALLGAIVLLLVIMIVALVL